MKKHEFLGHLANAISALQPDEKERALEFYSELIDDRIENGMNEEDAVSNIGSVNSVAQKLLSDSTFFQRTAGKRVALWCTCWLWAPLLFAAIAVLFTLYLVGWSLVASFWAVTGALAITCVYGIGSFFIVLSHSIPAALFQIGASIFSGGLAILLFVGMVQLTKLYFRASNQLFILLKNLLKKAVM